MIVEKITGHTFYANKERTRTDIVMDGDNDSHAYAVEHGLRSVDEVEYWLIKLKIDREERDRRAIEGALRVAGSGFGYPVEVT